MSRYIDYLYGLVDRNGLENEEITFSQSLYEKLMNRDYMENGRSKTKEDVLESLINEVEKFNVNTLEGALASVFIYHQIAEEWLFDLLELIRFYIDLKLYPDQIPHENLRKASEGQKMSGLLAEIKSLIAFEHKDDVVKYGDLINQKRNVIAHKLLQQNSVEAIKKETANFRKHFELFRRELEGDVKSPDGARESLLERIKEFHKWSDNFYDKYLLLLAEVLEDNEISFVSEEIFASKS